MLPTGNLKTIYRSNLKPNELKYMTSYLRYIRIFPCVILFMHGINTIKSVPIY